MAAASTQAERAAIKERMVEMCAAQKERAEELVQMVFPSKALQLDVLVKVPSPSPGSPCALHLVKPPVCHQLTRCLRLAGEILGQSA